MKEKTHLETLALGIAIGVFFSRPENVTEFMKMLEIAKKKNKKKESKDGR